MEGGVRRDADGRSPALPGWAPLVLWAQGRLLGAELRMSAATVARIWRKWDLQPWRVETFTFSTAPELEAKIRDVVGLYLDPPANAVVVSIDVGAPPGPRAGGKSQIQALDRTPPCPGPLPAGPPTHGARPVDNEGPEPT